MGRALLRWIALAALVVIVGACGGAGSDLNQLVGTYDGGSATQGNNPPPTPYQDPFAGAPAYSGASGGDGSHHPGEACMQSGCHASLGGRSDPPEFLIGGTVYRDYSGQVPAAGVEIRIVDGNGHAASTYSGREGNFFIPASASNGVTFPAVIGARDGTIARPMIRSLADPTMGSCAQSSCHVAGGSPATGAYYPIHVP
jgi:hypothetical protein